MGLLGGKEVELRMASKRPRSIDRWGEMGGIGRGRPSCDGIKLVFGGQICCKCRVFCIITLLKEGKKPIRTVVYL